MRRMLCGGTAMLNTLSWAVNTSPLTLSRHVSGVFENAIRWAMSATFTAVSAVPLRPLNRQAATRGKPVFTAATELP